MAKLYVESELCHYGVPGMKWGVRKKPSTSNVEIFGKSTSIKKQDLNKTKKWGYNQSQDGAYVTTGPNGKRTSKANEGKSLYDGVKIYDTATYTSNGKKVDPKPSNNEKPNEQPKKPNEQKPNEQPKKPNNSNNSNNKPDNDKLQKENKAIVDQNLRSSRTIVQESAKIADSSKKMVDLIPAKKQRLDLSNMTDKQLNDALNRYRLEQQYNEAFAQPTKVEKGKQIASGILAGAGAALTVAGSALSIALAIREFKKKPV